MKKLCALISFTLTLVLITGASWALDPQHRYDVDEVNNNEAIFNRYRNSDVGFYYQLRDVSRSRYDPTNVAGPQWFATVYENYFWNLYNPEDTDHAGMYRRTLGGEIPEISIDATGDLLNGFNYVFLYEPEPYEQWRNTGIVNMNDYDNYPDPIESLCIVTTRGSAEFDINFENPFARHFPFWWGIDYTSINAPIAYRIENDNVYTGKTNNIAYTISGNEILKPDGTLAFTISDNEVYNASDVLAYVISSDSGIIYDASGNEVYSIEESNNVTYICNFRNVNESFAPIEIDGYRSAIEPDTPQPVGPGDSLNAHVTLTAEDPDSYGSTLGYIGFKQQADFATGYTGYREQLNVPLVVANVSDGNASENPLYFDMLIFNGSNIVNRVKFRWNAESNSEQDIGTFFMMQQYNTNMPTYNLETRITNRTGTRYRLQRYDMISGENRGSYQDIRPDHWKYDLTEDLYGTVPSSFHLDDHSQIAPGLITVYRSNVSSGLSTIDTSYDTSESFRLYEYSSSTPRNLRLNYKRIAGMTTAGGRNTIYSGDVGVQGFNMQFTDVRNDSTNTERQLTEIMGKPPVLVQAAGSSVTPSITNINSSALYAFEINKAVPAGLVSFDKVDSEDASGQNISVDVPAVIALQPVSIRLKISRQNRLLNTGNRWEELEDAERSRYSDARNASALINAFAKYGTVWVRSDYTNERDTNLFTAISNRGADLSNCIRAFTYNNDLYLDFMVFIADAESIREGRTAFIETFEDDGVPYILIGDGKTDDRWNLKFYVGASGSNPDIDPSQEPGENGDDGDSGGSGCNSGIGILGLAAISCIYWAAKRR